MTCARLQRGKTLLSTEPTAESQHLPRETPWRGLRAFTRVSRAARTPGLAREKGTTAHATREKEISWGSPKPCLTDRTWCRATCPHSLVQTPGPSLSSHPRGHNHCNTSGHLCPVGLCSALQERSSSISPAEQDWGILVGDKWDMSWQRVIAAQKGQAGRSFEPPDQVGDVPAHGRGLEWMLVKVPSNPNHSVSPWSQQVPPRETRVSSKEPRRAGVPLTTPCIRSCQSPPARQQGCSVGTAPAPSTQALNRAPSRGSPAGSTGPSQRPRWDQPSPKLSRESSTSQHLHSQAPKQVQSTRHSKVISRKCHPNAPS